MRDISELITRGVFSMWGELVSKANGLLGLYKTNSDCLTCRAHK